MIILLITHCSMIALEFLLKSLAIYIFVLKQYLAIRKIRIEVSKKLIKFNF